MGLFDIFKKKNEPEQTKESEPEQAPAETEQPEPPAEARPSSEQKKNGFVGFALMSEGKWDKERFKRDLTECWELSPDEKDSSDDDVLIYSIDDMRVIVGLVDAPVPNGEAEANAADNYLWPKAEETVKAHRAHIIVSVSGEGSDPIKRGKLFVKLLYCCCRQPDVLGIYSGATVFEPQFYTEAAEIMKNGALPLLNWIWFGLYKREDKVCCYTRGMESFGKEEIEIIDADGQPADVRDFLLDMVSYVLESNVTLKDGETIGFSADDKHAIAVSEGVALPGITVKISY